MVQELDPSPVTLSKLQIHYPPYNIVAKALFPHSEPYADMLQIVATRCCEGNVAGDPSRTHDEPTPLVALAHKQVEHH